MFVLIVVFLPLLVCYSIYEWIKDYFKRRAERRKIDAVLHEISFEENITKGTYL